MNIEKEKQRFLRGMAGWKNARGGPKDKQGQALTNAINAALLVRANPVYAGTGGHAEIRDSWREELRKTGGQYGRKVSEDAHIKNIRKIADVMSRKHPRLLQKRKMRVGVSQKALNLYLKHLWCMGQIPEPPHCPIDRIALQEAGVHENWTEMDSIPDYRRWIKECRKAADGDSLPVWELKLVNSL